MNKYAVIVAGGKGLRMGADLPKQFIPINGKPLLMHTIKAFLFADPNIKVLLVLPHTHQSYWKELCQTYGFDLPHTLVDGGETRYHSVKNGLDLVPEGALVAVHDGVRPFVSKSLILNTYEQAAVYGGVIPTIPMVDSLRYIEPNDTTTSVDRSHFIGVQTPQTFESTLIKAAYDLGYDALFTDDASVYEASGRVIHCVEGERENIKITTPLDLKIAQVLMTE